LIKLVEAYTVEAEALTPMLEKLKEDYRTAVEQKDVYDALIRYVELTPLLKNRLWKPVLKVLASNPAEIPLLVQAVDESLSKEKEQYDHRRSLELVNRDLRIHEAVSENNDKVILNGLMTDLETIEDQIDKLRGDKAVWAKRFNTVENYLSKMGEAKAAIEENLKNNRLKLDIAIKSLLEAEFSILQNEIIQVERALEEVRSRNEIITALEERIAENKEKVTTYSVIEKNLSPHTGLIGSSLKNTIDAILLSVNDIIARVWSFEFEVLSPEINNGRMTYVLPARIKGKPRKDIRRCSGGEREIIDLAFKLVVYKVMDLEDYPLILDELGNTLHVSHRNKLYSYLYKTLPEYEYSMLMMTTHFNDLEAYIPKSEYTTNTIGGVSPDIKLEV
jgi:hypothetical protein